MKSTILTYLSAGSTAAFLTAFQKYIFSDVEYLKWLLIAVTLDLITGITKVWVKEGFSAVTSMGLRMTITKFVQYGAFLIITHVLTNFTVGGATSPLAFVSEWGYYLLILIEIKSVYENIIVINPHLDFVKGIIEKITQVINTKKNNNEETV